MQGGNRRELLRKRKGKKGPSAQEEIQKMIARKQRGRARLRRCCGACRSSPYFPNTGRKACYWCLGIFFVFFVWMYSIGAMYFEEYPREMVWKLPKRKLARRLGGHCDFDRVDISELDEMTFRSRLVWGECGAVRCGAVRCSAGAVRCGAVQCGGVQFSASASAV